MSIVAYSHEHSISVAKQGKQLEEFWVAPNNSTLNLGSSCHFVWRPGTTTGGAKEFADLKLEYSVTNKDGDAGKFLTVPGSLWGLLTRLDVYINGYKISELDSRSINLHQRYFEQLAANANSKDDFYWSVYEDTGFNLAGGAWGPRRLESCGWTTVIRLTCSRPAFP